MFDHKHYDRLYYQKHKEAKKEKSRLWRLKNKDKIREYVKLRYKTHQPINPEYYLFVNAKSRSKRYGIPFNLELSDIKIPQFCPVLGIELKKGIGKVSDSSPTIDRLDNTKGYTKGNILVVSFKANRLKSNASVEELEKVYKWVEQCSNMR